MKCKALLFLVSLLLITCDSSDSNSRTAITTFFEQFKTEGSDVAIDHLFATNKWTKESKEQIEITKANFKTALKLLGDYHGYEELSIIKVSDNLKHFVYLARFERQPLRLSFTLYRPFDKWQVQNFNYDYHILEELKEASELQKIVPTLN